MSRAVCSEQCPAWLCDAVLSVQAPGVSDHFGSLLAEQQPSIDLSWIYLSVALKSSVELEWRLLLAQVQEEGTELQTIVEAWTALICSFLRHQAPPVKKVEGFVEIT